MGVVESIKVQVNSNQPHPSKKACWISKLRKSVPQNLQS